MDQRRLKLPRSILHEMGIYDVGSGSKSRLKSHRDDRKASRKASRKEKRQHAHLKRTSANSQLEVQGKKKAVSKNEPTKSRPASEVSLPAKVKKQALLLDQYQEPLEPKTARRTRDRLEQDDADIAALERRLGIKSKKLPKSFDEDGLGDLLEGLGSEDDEDDDSQLHKKARISHEEEDWLQSKRLKALNLAREVKSDELLSEDDVDGDDFEDFSEEDESEHILQEQRRENPYVAPVSSADVKYIPPSLRRITDNDNEGLERLRRQIQGTLNRLSEAKVLSIAADIDKMYRNNPRQHVSTLLLDSLFGTICDPSPLQDTFMILHGGFVAALYKMIGTEFGAQIVQRCIEEYDQLTDQSMEANVGRRLSNLVTFVAELYNLRVIGSQLMYDIIRNLTEDLSETTAEILLRIIRIAGTQLRQDHSSSLKDIVILLHTSVAKIGAENISIRTKFMIETIEDLKNNKFKANVAASTIRTEHTTAMKKVLGSIKSSIIKAREPLCIGLNDIRNADKHGKWWVVGASFKEHMHTDKQPVIRVTTDIPMDRQENEIDVEQVARDQGMNTEIRRAIFISIVTSYDNKEACMRLEKLPLKKKQKFEIPRVVVHCVGAEKKYYNRFYTKIARHLCKDRDMRKSFAFALWDIFRDLEDDDEAGDDQDNPRLDTTSIVYVARMFGELVAYDRQNVLLLKHLDLAHPEPKLKVFAEVFLITIFQKASSKLETIFAMVKEQPEMIADLQLFLKKTVRKTNLLANPEDKEKVKTGCKIAESVLLELMSSGVGREELADLV